MTNNYNKTKKVGLGDFDDVCGDRMPSIYINRVGDYGNGQIYHYLGFQILSCVNDNKGWLYRTEDDENFPERTGLTKGKWYKVEVGQEYQQQKSGYFYYIAELRKTSFQYLFYFAKFCTIFLKI